MRWSGWRAAGAIGAGLCLPRPARRGYVGLPAEASGEARGAGRSTIVASTPMASPSRIRSLPAQEPSDRQRHNDCDGEKRSNGPLSGPFRF